MILIFLTTVLLSIIRANNWIIVPKYVIVLCWIVTILYILCKAAYHEKHLNILENRYKRKNEIFIHKDKK